MVCAVTYYVLLLLQATDGEDSLGMRMRESRTWNLRSKIWAWIRRLMMKWALREEKCDVLGRDEIYTIGSVWPKSGKMDGEAAG